MDPRSLTKDFREFLQCLNEQGAEKNKKASGRNKDLADLENLP
jgi:hypothetical protein